MLYVSTRGGSAAAPFSDILLAGLARDGGLYVPEAWPRLAGGEIAALAGLPYAQAARRVIAPFVDFDDGVLGAMCESAYAGFRHPATVPLVQIGPNTFVLELFHGPTLAFKDVAMQLLARQMAHVLEARGERVTIIGATSGDTGSAAIEAFAGLDAVDVFILFPHGRVSEVQRRQMTCLDAGNVHAIAVDGTFDDCQALVKAMFNDHPFRDRLNLSGVNSINWARIIAQAVYYFTAAVSLGAPHRPVSFSVPTGNFGDVFAGYVARAMGLPVERLMVATNVNDILVRTLETGRYEARGVTPTQSPSMDIEVSSNFERLLFDVHGRDAASVRRLMDGLAQAKAFTVEQAPLSAMRKFLSAARIDEARTTATIAKVHAETGYLIDPHTAVGVAAAEHLAGDAPVVALATAHPAKFPDAVQKACGVRPPLPPHLEGLMDRRERFARIANDLSAVERLIEDRASRVAA